MSLKWPVLCWVGRKTLNSQSLLSPGYVWSVYNVAVLWCTEWGDCRYPAVVCTAWQPQASRRDTWPDWTESLYVAGVGHRCQPVHHRGSNWRVQAGRSRLQPIDASDRQHQSWKRYWEPSTEWLAFFFHSLNVSCPIVRLYHTDFAILVSYVSECSIWYMCKCSLFASHEWLFHVVFDLLTSVFWTALFRCRSCFNPSATISPGAVNSNSWLLFSFCP